MISEMDRVVALILIASAGPTPEQIVEKRLTKAQLRFGHDVLWALAFKLREGLHMQIPDELVKKVLAGDHDG